MKRIALLSLILLSACGQPTVESSPATADGAVTADGGADGAVIGDECITDFDCKDAKGKTPCGLPLCTAGFCGW